MKRQELKIPIPKLITPLSKSKPKEKYASTRTDEYYIDRLKLHKNENTIRCNPHKANCIFCGFNAMLLHSNQEDNSSNKNRENSKDCVQSSNRNKSSFYSEKRGNRNKSESDEKHLQNNNDNSGRIDLCYYIDTLEKYRHFKEDKGKNQNKITIVKVEKKMNFSEYLIKIIKIQRIWKIYYHEIILPRILKLQSFWKGYFIRKRSKKLFDLINFISDKLSSLEKIIENIKKKHYFISLTLHKNRKNLSRLMDSIIKYDEQFKKFEGFNRIKNYSDMKIKMIFFKDFFSLLQINFRKKNFEYVAKMLSLANKKLKIQDVLPAINIIKKIAKYHIINYLLDKDAKNRNRINSINLMNYLIKNKIRNQGLNIINILSSQQKKICKLDIVDGLNNIKKCLRKNYFLDLKKHKNYFKFLDKVFNVLSKQLIAIRNYKYCLLKKNFSKLVKIKALVFLKEKGYLRISFNKMKSIEKNNRILDEFMCKLFNKKIKNSQNLRFINKIKQISSVKSRIIEIFNRKDNDKLLKIKFYLWYKILLICKSSLKQISEIIMKNYKRIAFKRIFNKSRKIESSIKVNNFYKNKIKMFLSKFPFSSINSCLYVYSSHICEKSEGSYRNTNLKTNHSIRQILSTQTEQITHKYNSTPIILSLILNFKQFKLKIFKTIFNYYNTLKKTTNLVKIVDKINSKNKIDSLTLALRSLNELKAKIDLNKIFRKNVFKIHLYPYLKNLSNFLKLVDLIYTADYTIKFNIKKNIFSGLFQNCLKFHFNREYQILAEKLRKNSETSSSYYLNKNLPLLSNNNNYSMPLLEKEVKNYFSRLSLKSKDNIYIRNIFSYKWWIEKNKGNSEENSRDLEKNQNIFKFLKQLFKHYCNICGNEIISYVCCNCNKVPEKNFNIENESCRIFNFQLFSKEKKVNNFQASEEMNFQIMKSMIAPVFPKIIINKVKESNDNDLMDKIFENVKVNKKKLNNELEESKVSSNISNSILSARSMMNKANNKAEKLVLRFENNEPII